MKYSIAIFLVFILPIAIRNYKQDGKKWIYIKIFNLLITLYMFVLFSGSFNNLISGIIYGRLSILKNLPTWLNITYNVISRVFMFFTIVQIVKLAFRIEKARKVFLWIIPFLWVFTGVLMYEAFIKVYNEVPDNAFIIFINTMFALIYGGMFLFYRSKKTKDFFQVLRK
jgi:hypothetical protein